MTVSGNALSVVGDSTANGSTTAVGTGNGAPAQDPVVQATSGKNGILSGNQSVLDVTAPVTVSGNALSVVGDSTANGSTTVLGGPGCPCTPGAPVTPITPVIPATPGLPVIPATPGLPAHTLVPTAPGLPVHALVPTAWTDHAAATTGRSGGRGTAMAAGRSLASTEAGDRGTVSLRASTGALDSTGADGLGMLLLAAAVLLTTSGLLIARRRSSRR
ncbi:hypothetical protein GCM10027449_21500 [Sinomonas notoginsengisoli]